MELTELYQEILLDHYRRPRGAARLDHLPQSRVHENPTCGDSIKVEVQGGADGRIEVRHEAHGCAISTASASMMSERLSGATAAEARETALEFLRILRGEQGADALDQWGDLASLKGVLRLPVRVKCATLAWHALLDSLLGEPVEPADPSAAADPASPSI
jgi:nitrogen fixation NifU-like protein